MKRYRFWIGSACVLVGVCSFARGGQDASGADSSQAGPDEGWALAPDGVGQEEVTGSQHEAVAPALADDRPTGVADGQPAVSYGDHQELMLQAGPEKYEGPKSSTFSLTGGSMWFQEGTIGEHFEPFTPALRLQLGKQYFNQIQLTAELGLFWDTGFNRGIETGEVSNDETVLTFLPGSLGLSYRFDYFEEQALVPYVGGGLTGAIAWLREAKAAAVDDTTAGDTGGDGTTETTETTSKLSRAPVLEGTIAAETDPTASSMGTRFGGYIGGGLEILLDAFEPARAADLERGSGVNDSYLIIDVRYYQLDRYILDSKLVRDTGDIQFDGFQLTVGLKFDF